MLLWMMLVSVRVVVTEREKKDRISHHCGGAARRGKTREVPTSFPSGGVNFAGLDDDGNAQEITAQLLLLVLLVQRVHYSNTVRGPLSNNRTCRNSNYSI